MRLLEQISEFLKRMEPRQKRKASRLGEQVGRAGWTSRLGEQVGRAGFFFHKRFSTKVKQKPLKTRSKPLKTPDLNPIQFLSLDRFFSNKHSASELILRLLEQISKFLKRMEPCQKRKAHPLDRFLGNKHTASELILRLLEQISEFLKRMEPRQKRQAPRLGERVGRAGLFSTNALRT